ncbi:MAG: CT583 family protein, partial [Chlamydiia bacterium]|nr:CT583 family protein [Chlamydiia bacterium]
ASDFESLRVLNCEIKNINAQSMLLDGERIRKAQDILKKYREGAFTAWLIETYGNRQTPYSILQYCDLHSQLPSEGLKKKLENIPRKAAYTLAGRSGALHLKRRILEDHGDEGQKELIMIIQDTFPLSDGDRRQRKEANLATLDSIGRLCKTLIDRKGSLTEKHRGRIKELVEVLEELLSEDEEHSLELVEKI